MWRDPPTTNRLVLAFRIVLHAAPPAVLVAVGVYVIAHPPPSVAASANGVLRLAWAAALILGGLLTLCGMARRRIRPQLAGRGLTAAAAAFYAVHLLTVPSGLAAAGLVGALALADLGELYRSVDLARWSRADRDRSRRRHPAGRGRLPGRG